MWIPPKYFVVQEYVPRYVFEKWGSQAWQFLDERLLQMDFALRERFGRITINNWHLGGEREWSGLRTPRSPYYSELSQHSFGRASDKLFHDTTTEEVRAYILANPTAFPFISAVELDTSWLHTDVRNVKPIFTFKP